MAMVMVAVMMVMMTVVIIMMMVMMMIMHINVAMTPWRHRARITDGHCIGDAHGGDASHVDGFAAADGKIRMHQLVRTLVVRTWCSK